MGKFFICYRRDDAGDYAGRVCDNLVNALPDNSVFMDTASLRGGVRWADELQQTLQDAVGVLVIIGPAWLTLERDGQTRLSYEDDWVRTEIRTALTLGKPILPIVADDKLFPAALGLPEDIRQLALIQYHVVRGTTFRRDFEFVLEWAEDVLRGEGHGSIQRSTRSRTATLKHPLLLLIVAGVLLAGLSWSVWARKGDDDIVPIKPPKPAQTREQNWTTDTDHEP